VFAVSHDHIPIQGNHRAAFSRLVRARCPRLDAEQSCQIYWRMSKLRAAEMPSRGHVGGLILVNDMTFFPRDEQQLVQSDASQRNSARKGGAEYFPAHAPSMNCKESNHNRAVQPGCSSQPLRHSRRAGGDRRSHANGPPERGAGPRARFGYRVHRRRDPATSLRANDAPPAALRNGL